LSKIENLLVNIDYATAKNVAIVGFEIAPLED
jgi:hypothetical protein